MFLINLIIYIDTNLPLIKTSKTEKNITLRKNLKNLRGLIIFMP